MIISEGSVFKSFLKPDASTLLFLSLKKQKNSKVSDIQHKNSCTCVLICNQYFKNRKISHSVSLLLTEHPVFGAGECLDLLLCISWNSFCLQRESTRTDPHLHCFDSHWYSSQWTEWGLAFFPSLWPSSLDIEGSCGLVWTRVSVF